MLEKGKEYERKLSAKRIEKSKKDHQECTFKPKILTENTANNAENRENKVHEKLYDKGLALWKERQLHNKTTEEVEFEKVGFECVFRPNATRLKFPSQSAYNSTKRESNGYDSQIQQPRGEVSLERSKKRSISGGSKKKGIPNGKSPKIETSQFNTHQLSDISCKHLEK